MCDYKNATDLGKLCFLPKIHRRLSNILGWLIIYNINVPTENLPILDYHLKSVMQSGSSYVKDSRDFKEKIKNASNITEMQCYLRQIL